MDRDWAKPWESENRDGDSPAGFTLPSRVAALNAVVPALRSQLGLVLVTGEPGVGKTWLGEQIRSHCPFDWRGVAVDPSPANDAFEFYRLLGDALGLQAAADLGSCRVELAGFLRESSAEGASWVLTVDEAHGLSLEVLEEIRLLSNRLGRPDGFAGMILLGQTVLARRLAARPLAAFAARIAARAHLRTLDIEETQTLAARFAPSLAVRGESLEILHRQVGGNPKRLLDVVRLHRLLASPARPSVPQAESPTTPAGPPMLEPTHIPPSPTPAPIDDVAPAPPPRWDAPVLGEGKPPLRIEDGLIEVGWEPDSEIVEPRVHDDSPLDPAQTHDDAPPGPLAEEAIQDRYAALQAWNEWAQNQGRAASNELAAASDETAETADELALQPQEHPVPESPIPPGVWADGQQSFAPYGQLFTKLKQRRDTL